MAKLSTMALTGASGTEYEFHVYPSNTTFENTFECVYYISNRVTKQDGRGSHTNIYVGQTEDFNDRHGNDHKNHHKYDCFVQNGFNVISVHMLNGKDNRETVEQDLIDALNLPCNG